MHVRLNYLRTRESRVWSSLWGQAAGGGQLESEV